MFTRKQWSAGKYGGSLKTEICCQFFGYCPCNCPGGKGHAKQTSGGKVPGGE